MSSGEHRLELADTEPCGPPSERPDADTLPAMPPAPRLDLTIDILIEGDSP